MPKITKVSSETLRSKVIPDKTDWKKVYQQSQSEADQEAKKDQDNPIVKVGKLRRMAKKP